jgi:hypothetical protein
MFCISHIVAGRWLAAWRRNPTDRSDGRGLAGLLIGAVAGVGLWLQVGAVTGLLS